MKNTSKHSRQHPGRTVLRIERLEDRRMLTSIWEVTSPHDDGTGDGGTLSAAINNANAFFDPGEFHIIRFDLFGTTNEFINVSGELPAITAPFVKIDGLDSTLDPDQFPTDKRVILNGPNTSNVGALVYQGDEGSAPGHFQVHNIKIRKFDRDAILIESLDTNDRVTIDNTVLTDNSYDGGPSPNGSGIRFMELPFGGSTGMFTITDNVIARNGRHGITLKRPSNFAPGTTASFRITLLRLYLASLVPTAKREFGWADGPRRLPSKATRSTKRLALRPK